MTVEHTREGISPCANARLRREPALGVPVATMRPALLAAFRAEIDDPVRGFDKCRGLCSMTKKRRPRRQSTAERGEGVSVCHRSGGPVVGSSKIYKIPSFCLRGEMRGKLQAFGASPPEKCRRGTARGAR